MPNMTDIKQLVADLHDRKIVNANTTLSELVAVQGGHLSPGQAADGWYIAGGEHYVIVCGMTAAGGKVSLPGSANPFGK